MSYKVYLLFVIMTVLSMASCEKIVNIDLNSSSPKYVIEGSVTNTSSHQIKITQSKNFDEENEFEGVDHAEVIISDDEDNSEILMPVGSGMYQGDDDYGRPGRTYTLTVNINEETFTSSSRMPEPVNFDSLYTEDVTFFGETLKLINALYSDPKGIENYYRHVLYVNGEKSNSIFVSSDAFFEGKDMERPLPYGDFEDGLVEGDQVLVEMQSIDKQVYEYFATLIKTINRSEASPANPASNINGGALGYFSAHTVQVKELVIE
ncbi:MAG: DUF4249 domain-containing protein [Balneolales bacterium]